MAKTHLKIIGVDRRSCGQTEYELSHQAACGYVRDKVTKNMDNVDCFYCLRSEDMKHYHQINSTFTGASGAY